MSVKPYTNDSFEQAALVDPSRRVQVYKNLHQNVYSVRQDGIVKFHAHSIWLKNARYNVSQAGNAKVRREGKKNVHATVSGYLTLTLPDHTHRITYNPYKHFSFVYDATQMPVKTTETCSLDRFGIWA